jgi:signal transduction histidine kinase
MSLKTKLTFLFAAFTVLTLVLFGAIVFSQARQTLKTLRVAQLNSIADLKKDKIETFFIERTSDLASTRNFSDIRKYLLEPDALARPGNRARRAALLMELDAELKPLQTGYPYIDIMLLDRHGRIVYVSNREHHRPELGTFLSDLRMFEQGRDKIYFTDVFWSEIAGRKYEMLGVAPVHDAHDRFIGEVVIEIDMEPIYRFMQDTTGLGETGESLIDREAGDEVLFLSPLRHAPDAALQLKVPLNDKLALAAQKAAAGENGSGVAYDYRGTQVLAAWRYIPSLRWGLVTKIDASEAFAPVTNLRDFFLVVGAVLLITGIMVSIAIANAVTRPVLALQRGTEAVAAGDLGQKVGTGSRDEIGRLSRAFDSMSEALARDRAGREKAEAEVRKLNEDLLHHVHQLEESNRELDAFSYSVSHDLRSPLRGIEGFSLALLEDYSGHLDDRGKDYLNRVRNATVRMGQLIDDLLKLSRVTRSEMNREDVDLSAIARTIADDLKSRHPERPARFIIAEGLIAYCDERLLTVAMENMFLNAWKFSAKTPHAVIEFGIAEKNGTRAFFVKDNGVGFDMTYAGKLFNPFQRLHRTEEFPGTGIGLATVKRIVSRHGGQVWIESEEGKGAAVYFTLT